MTIKRIYLCGLLAFIAAGAGVSYAKNWPCFRGPSRQGISREKDVPLEWSATSNIVWKMPIPGEGVVPSVVIGDGLIFTASGFENSTIRVVHMGGQGDVTDTHIAWTSTKDVPKGPSMLYVKPLLCLVTEAGVAKCLEATTSKVLWKERLGGRHSASPIWAEGRIYFLSEKDKTAGIKAGFEFNVLAENELNEKCCSSPVVSNKQLCIRSEHNLYCISVK